MRSAPVLWLEPHASRLALGMMAIIGAMAILAILLCGMPDPWRSLSAVGMALFLVRALVNARQQPNVRLTLLDQDLWRVESADTAYETRLVGRHDLGVLIALRFRAEDGRRSDFVFWPDALTQDARRRLRIWLSRQGNR